jgi:addiction module HigA family antidote
MAPIHPGEVLREEFMLPRDLNANRLAAALRVPAKRVNDILEGRRGISAEMALRLARFFGTTPQFWMRLQEAFDLRTAELEQGDGLERIVPLSGLQSTARRPSASRSTSSGAGPA